MQGHVPSTEASETRRARPRGFSQQMHGVLASKPDHSLLHSTDCGERRSGAGRQHPLPFKWWCADVAHVLEQRPHQFDASIRKLVRRPKNMQLSPKHSTPRCLSRLPPSSSLTARPAAPGSSAPPPMPGNPAAGAADPRQQRLRKTQCQCCALRLRHAQRLCISTEAAQQQTQQQQDGR